MSGRILVGHVLDQLATLDAASVQCVVTSPPYFNLRAYGTDPQVWGGDADCAHTFLEVLSAGKSGGLTAKQVTNAGSFAERQSTGECACGAWRGELGSEPTPALFVAHLVDVFRAVRRVLHPTGVLFCNLGDSYAGSGNGAHDYRERAASKSLSLNPDKYQGQHAPPVQRVGPQEHTEGSGRVPGMKAKDLMLIPWRFAIAMADDGWYVRSAIVWAKKSCMPESVTDRPTSAWEPIFLFTKQARYFYDAAAVREPLADGSVERYASAFGGKVADARIGQGLRTTPRGMRDVPIGANQRNVWRMGPEPSREEHYAAYPTEIPRRAILAGTSERGQCPACGSPWRRVVQRTAYTPPIVADGERNVDASRGDKVRKLDGKSAEWRASQASVATTGWEPSCTCNAGEPIPQTVLDPFLGSGTTGMVADQLGRNWVGVELNPAYAGMAQRRITGDAPLFVESELVA